MKTKLTAKEIKRHKDKLIGKLAVAAKRAKQSGGKPFILNLGIMVKSYD